LGKRGSGKTTYGLAVSRFHKNVVALDVLGDLPGKWGELKKTADLAKISLGGRWRMNVPEWIGSGWEQSGILRTVVSYIKILLSKHLLRGGCCLFIDEADYWGNTWKNDPHITEVIKYGRHWGMMYICTSRRYAEIPKAYIANADWVCAGQSIDPADREVLRRIGFSDADYPSEEYTFLCRTVDFAYKTRYVKDEGVIEYDVL